MPDPAVECRRVWKIFGDKASQAFAAIEREGLGKDEVAKRFGCVIGVADATFAIETGEIFCIMGLSGSGKSTLVRHINRLIEPTAGHVLIHGEDINAKSADALRRLRAEKIGMVFQHMALFPHRSVRDNVAYGLEVRGIERKRRWAMAAEKLALVRLTGWEHRYPHELSGGMQQRVGLARALAADPDILLMDEPFSALDPLIRRQLQDEFIQLAGVVKKTTLFITHDLDEAIRLGHRIAVMRDGRLIQMGSPEAIVLHPIDDYVAEFVKGISRLRFLTAERIMEPWNEGAGAGADLNPADCTTVRPETDAATLIAVAAESDHPVIVVDSENRPVGVVTPRGLLRAIRSSAT